MSKDYKFQKIIFALVIVFLAIGCGEPKFNKNNKVIAFFNGIPIAVPGMAFYGQSLHKIMFPYTMKIKKTWDPVIKKKYSKYITKACKENEILWISPEIKNDMNIALKSKDIIKVWELEYQGKITGKAGCAHALNQQEYQYMLNQENQRAANMRVSSQNSAIMGAVMMPKNHNVNHTTSVNVNRSYRNDHTYQVNTGL